MWLRVGRVGLVMAGAALLTLDVLLPGGLVAGHESLELARTAAFTTLVLAQLVNAFCARSATASAFHRLLVNPWLWGALALSLALQVAVVHVPLLNTAFGTAPLDAGQWLVALALSSLVLVASEVRKLLLRANGVA